MTEHPWKAAHDALKQYHAERRRHGSSHGAQLAAWGRYIEALGAAQHAERAADCSDQAGGALAGSQPPMASAER